MATLYYVVYPSALGTPTAAQVKAGQNPSGAAATASGSETALTADGTQTWATLASGLTAATGYKIAFVWTDSGVDSGVVVGTFSTLSTASAPSVAARRTDSDSGNVTGHGIGLPTGIVAGNLLLVVVTMSGTGAVTINTGTSGTNWSIIGNVTSATSRSLVIAKIAEGGDALALTTSTARAASYVGLRITGAGGLPTAASATGSDANPEPPSATASGDANRLWVAARSTTSALTSSAPTGYTNSQASITAGGSVTTTQTAERTLYDATEDPGAFPVGTSADWVAWTIYVDPVVIRSAQADQNVPAFTAGQTAQGRPYASVSHTVPGFTSAQTAQVRAAATSTHAIGAFTASQTAQARAAATVNHAIPAFTQALTAARIVSAASTHAVGTFTPTATAAARAGALVSHAVPAFGQAATVQQVMAGTAYAEANQSVPPFGSSPTAQGRPAATSTHAIPAFGTAATLQGRPAAEASQSVPAFGQTATATFETVTGAGATQVVPGFGGIQTATLLAQAQTTQAIPAFGGSASATTDVLTVGVAAAQQVQAFISTAEAEAIASLSGVHVIEMFGQIASALNNPATPVDQPAILFFVPADGLLLEVQPDGIRWSVPPEPTILEVTS